VSDGGAIQAGSAAFWNRWLKVDDLRELPAGIVQGRYDTVTPMATGWAWPEARFTIVDETNNAATDRALTLALGAASDRLCDALASAAA
jgi:proline iminopeptidase